jgi:hypothetical protein
MRSASFRDKHGWDNHMKSLVCLALFLSCLPCFSEGGGRTCRIIFPDRPRNAPEHVQLFDGTASRKVLLASMNFSDVVTLPAGDLVLGMTADPVAKGGELPEGAPTVKVHGSITDFYLIVVSDPDNKILPVRMLPVDAGDERPKTGQTLWVNLTTHSITLNLASGSLIVPPGERIVGEPPLAASGYYKAEFLYQPDGKGEFLPLMTKSWWFDANSCHLGFIMDSGRRLPTIFTIRDKRTPAVR